jgi:predicted nucleic acid-binding Zn ribbon protein
MPEPFYACRFCGVQYEPDVEDQEFCSDECESLYRKIDEAHQRADERRGY